MSNPSRSVRLALSLTAAATFALFVAGGALGVYRYARGYWLYRGFPPPREASYVANAGREEHFSLRSRALGGRSQTVFVYLPPGYDRNPNRRYPVLYLLHGTPGRPDGFLLALGMGVTEDALVAKHKIKPLILVMPFGSTSVFTDKEWANGIRPHEGWETFVSRDVVHAIDSRYRTIPNGAARAIGGLSEGGYGALNIGFHHPGEFTLLESWSGYELADNVKAIFGGKQALLRWNSPMKLLPQVAGRLKQANTAIWFYSGRHDPLRHENARFARELAHEGVSYTFFVGDGGHNWRLWRANVPGSLIIASAHLAHA